MHLFSYGSNHPAQLAERLGHKVITAAARLNGYERVFCGYSRRWGGGVASIQRARGGTVYGLTCQVTREDLDAMDRFEGVATGNYRRINVNVEDSVGRMVHAVAYVSNSTEFHEPSRAYLEAVAQTIGTYWRSSDGSKVTWRDVTVRPCGTSNPRIYTEAIMEKVIHEGLMKQWSVKVMKEEFAIAVYEATGGSLKSAAESVGMTRSGLREMISRGYARRAAQRIR